MKQNRYNTLAELLSAGTTASAGALTYAAILGMVVGNKVSIDLDVDALEAARDAHRSAREAFSLGSAQFKTKTKATYGFVAGTRDVLRRTLGNQYSAAWVGTGFNNSLRIPRSVAGLEDITHSLQTYLGDHPALEVAGLNITAAVAEQTAGELTDAKTAVVLQKAAVGTALTNRKQKEKALRRRLRGTAEELNRLIGPVDDRWTAFGFNKPGLKQTPPVPTKLSAVLVGSGLSLKWEKAPRAEYYRIWLKVNGVDQELLPVGSPADPNFTIESVPVQSVVEVAVSAVNNGGESARSAVMQVTIA